MEYNFAVVGKPISHSLSPVSFSKYIGNRKGYNYSRMLLQDIKKLNALIEAFDIRGINITSPFKKDILKLVNNRSREVKLLKVANTVIYKNNTAKAYNTDLIGVKNPLLKRKVSSSDNVLVLGAGGAARAIVLALEDIGFKNISLSNRSRLKAEEIKKYHKIEVPDFNRFEAADFDIIINTIPVKSKNFEKFELKQSTIVFDANYSTRPLEDIAKKYDCTYIDGLEWLIEQGKLSYELMTGIEDGEIVFNEIDKQNIKNKSKTIALIGPMGSWKSSVGKHLAKSLNFDFYDIDNLIEEHVGTSITDIFSDKGEAFFREIESDILKKTLKNKNIVLATGGGIIKRNENIGMLQQNSWNILLYASPQECFNRINIDKRPLLKGKDVLNVLTKLFNQRKTKYFKTSDLIINTENSTSKKIANILYEDYSKTFGI